MCREVATHTRGRKAHLQKNKQEKTTQSIDIIAAKTPVLQALSTHTAVHACGVCQQQPVDALVGADEDDDIVEVLLHVDSSRQHGAVGELDFDGIVEQVGVQRLLHQLHRVPGCGPV